MKYKVYHTVPELDFENNGNNVAFFVNVTDARDFAKVKKEMGRKVLVVLLVEQEVSI